MDEESRHALIIANDDYEEGGLQKLTSPAADAEALAEVLGDPRIGGFDVQVVRNEPSYVIRMRIEDFFADRRRDDTLLLHFSCHGLKSESGELYFAAPDTRPKRLKATGVASDFVQTCMADTRARTTVLFLDCCYGGAFSPGTVARAAGDAHVLENFAGDKLGGGGRGWAVVTASDSMQYAFEGARLADEADPKPSVFTNALVSGLATGEADRNEDGKVSLNELYDYVFDRVQRENRNQTPSCKSDLRGDLYLARSDRRRIVPAPLPPRLRDALAGEEVFTRLGAVTELRTRLEHTDPAIAAGAYEALKEVARNDIQAVAKEANRALGGIRITPDPATLRFDAVDQHAVPPQQHVRLLGPPLARSCTPQTRSDWLHAARSGDGLDVTVDTAAPGQLSGDLVLKGIVGHVVIRVEAEVRQPQPPAERPDGTPTVIVDLPKRPPGDPPVGETPTVVVHTPRIGSREPEGTHGPGHEAPRTGSRKPEGTHGPGHERTGSTARRPSPGLKAFRAPAVAVAALGLAVASLALGVKAALEAARLPQAGETWVNIRSHLAQESTRDLVICLVLALVSLILVTVARYDLRSSPGLYSKQRAAATSLVDWSAKVLALPVFVLALLGIIALMVAANIG
ncbi:caspase family protein [Streptomyces sp. NPDC000229]|uniref:caspase family protein n=1 Tax=Streptomyces sp. NPDC000229 TaxID=3154247 RepID=UPI0033333D95